jgi:tRNA-specific 2-thiouridylase
MKKRVLVAMSGGVDSSLSAALLVRQGDTVEGVTMKLTSGLCCDIGSAQAVCQHLGIPHRVIDAQSEFSTGIIQDFISEYRRGRTPNPCIRCNDLVKFQLLLEYARSNGFDAGKDQSYFLYRLTQEQMRSVLFPLGGMHKTEVKSLARELALPAAERPESQEICFVPDNNYRSFLKEHAPETLRPGDLVMTDGTIVGRHDGIAFFTVGQRRKLGVAAGERLYVVRVEPETNRVVLGKLSDLQARGMTVSDLNFIAVDKLHAPMNVTVKIRYRAPFVPAAVAPAASGRIRVQFEHPVPGVCPGQAAVFYDGDTVVGGGIIEK